MMVIFGAGAMNKYFLGIRVVINFLGSSIVKYFLGIFYGVKILQEFMARALSKYFLGILKIRVTKN